MQIVKKTLAAAVILALTGPAFVMAADRTTANVSVDSAYYSYIDKLSGMGYLKTLPNGARPYSRMQMARWCLEAEEKSAEKPIPAYLADELKALESYLAPEMSSLKGNPTEDTLRLRSVAVEGDYLKADRFSYSDATDSGSWAPFGANRNGHKYGRNGNLALSAEVSGNIGHETAISIKGRTSWDKDNDGTASLEEAYIKTRAGSFAFEAGRQALTWGQGYSGHLLLGNNMKPLTTLQAHLANPVKIGGFFHFLGDFDFHAFYGQLDKDRASDAQGRGVTDYDHPGILGLRVDLTPADWVTLGASRVSMMGGKHHSLDRSDWRKWTFGSNEDDNDKWDDIGGFDFKLRFPAFQLYGEFMGEDQAGGLPSKWGWRLGTYIPKLNSDGSWDMILETAKTTDVWYSHWVFQNGWTYSGDIMGDDMGNDARKYYARINHYLPGEKTLSFYGLRTERQKNRDGATVNEAGITGRMKLHGNMYLDGTLGYAGVKNHGTDHDYFGGVKVEWNF